MRTCNTCKYTAEDHDGEHCKDCGLSKHYAPGTWQALEEEVALLKKENLDLKKTSYYRGKEANCTRCLYMNEDSSGEHCGKCTHNYVSWFTPMTNSQYLRCLSDYDLAKWLAGDKCEEICGASVTCDGDCAEQIEEWLKEKRK